LEDKLGLYDTDKDAEDLSKIIAGATIRSAVMNKDSEGMFILRLEKEGKKFEVRIYGTDLGWWFKIAGNKLNKK